MTIYHMTEEVGMETGDLSLHIEDQQLWVYPIDDDGRELGEFGDVSMRINIGENHVVELIGTPDDPRSIIAVCFRPNPDLVDENGDVSSRN